jgi:hypothetical protein
MLRLEFSSVVSPVSSKELARNDGPQPLKSAAPYKCRKIR